MHMCVSWMVSVGSNNWRSDNMLMQILSNSAIMNLDETANSYYPNVKSPSSQSV